MNTIKYQCTDRILRIIHHAEREAETSEKKLLLPGHLLIACFREKTGVLGEIYLRCNIDLNEWRSIAGQQGESAIEVILNSSFFKTAVTGDVERVMELSLQYMKGYNQTYLNEGHLLKALMVSKLVDDYVSEENKSIIVSLGTTARDLITHLGNYQFPQVNSRNIRKVTYEDKEKLLSFVESQFSKEWSFTIEGAFSSREPSVYLALDSSEEIIGFAAYDVYQNRKGYFGPMGVSLSNRIGGVGFSLLHHCLKEMHKIGYEYAVLGGAGPIEFYEKACNAVVIPVS